MHLDQVVARSPQTASRIIDGEAVVLTADDSTFRVFNPVGTRIWDLLASPSMVRQIAAQICAEFEVAETQAQRDVVAFLQELAAKGMVTLAPQQE